VLFIVFSNIFFNFRTYGNYNDHNSLNYSNYPPIPPVPSYPDYSTYVTADKSSMSAEGHVAHVSGQTNHGYTIYAGTSDPLYTSGRFNAVAQKLSVLGSLSVEDLNESSMGTHV